MGPLRPLPCLGPRFGGGSSGGAALALHHVLLRVLELGSVMHRRCLQPLFSWAQDDCLVNAASGVALRVLILTGGMVWSRG